MLIMGEDVPEAPVLRISGSVWPFPPPSDSPGPLISICMPQSPIPSPSANQSDSETEHRILHVPWTLERVEYYQYKGEVVDWISHRISDGASVISDGTIGVIMSLIMWEVSLTRHRSLITQSHSYGKKLVIGTVISQGQFGDSSQVMITSFYPDSLALTIVTETDDRCKHFRTQNTHEGPKKDY
jgi:hypothetical protein